MVVKTHELRTKSKDDLFKQLEELKQELATCRVQKVSNGSNGKVTKIGPLRKDIARVLTVMNQKQRDNLRLFYKKSKYTPLDLRTKKTRALRRQLSKHEKSIETERQRKKRIHFGARLFAVKA